MPGAVARHYFFRDYGRADHLARLPASRVLRPIHRYGAKRLIGHPVENRAEPVVVVLLIVEAGSFRVVAAGSASPDADIGTAGDAM